MQVEEDPGDSSGKCCGHSDQPPSVCSGTGPPVAPGGFVPIRLTTVVRPQDGDRADLGCSAYSKKQHALLRPLKVKKK